MGKGRIQIQPGDRYGRLTVVGEAPRRMPDGSCRREVICRCDCGGETRLLLGNLRNRADPSCGCSTPPPRRQRRPGKPTNLKHGMSGSPEYKAWRSMLTRCYNPNTIDFGHYGGIGITVCERWRESFEAFHSDMGSRPSSGHSLDRIKTRSPLGYCKENVRWATAEEQAENKTNSRWWHVRGATFPSARKAADHFGVGMQTVVRWCHGTRANGFDHPARVDCWTELKYPPGP